MSSRHHRFVIVIFFVLWPCDGADNGDSKYESREVRTSQTAAASFTDPRDGKKYRTVKIGEQVWMAENLNYLTGNSWCYDNNSANCSKYGRLYDWNTASTACPSGWKLPGNEDWDNLAQAVGGLHEIKIDTGYHWWELPIDDNLPRTGGSKITKNRYWAVAGKKLKSRTGWDNNGGGTDDFGFSAMPGGDRGTDSSFYNAGSYGVWWSATETSNCCSAYRWSMRCGNENLSKDNYSKGYGNSVQGYGFSVRCVRKG